MSEQIDWSKAPEWATRLMRNKYGCNDAWADDHTDAIWVTDYESGSDMIFNLDPSVWGLIENRPTTPSWSGEGLPPVGVVCEMHYCGEWEKTEILCIGVKHVFIRQIAVTGEAFECSLNLSACQFRPIRTHEQIAADERERMANMLWQRYLQPILAPAKEAQVKEALGLIYDDFYRKP